MENLKCSHCSKILIPPIKFCTDGDVVCSQCASTYTECPVCKKDYLNIKIKTFENFLKDFKRECRGKQNGCQEELKPEDVDDHEQKCYYLRETVCHVPNCGKTVLSCQYMAHFNSTAFHQFYYNFRNVHLNFDVTQWKELRHSILVKDSNNGTFEINLKSCEKMLNLAVRFIGQKMFVQYFDLTITAISGKNEMKCVTHPLSFDVTEDELWQSPNFSILKDQCAANFPSGMISLEVYKNTPFQFQNVPTYNTGTNVFGPLRKCKMASNALFGSSSAAPTDSFGADPVACPPASQMGFSFGVNPAGLEAAQNGDNASDQNQEQKFNIFG